MSSWRFRLFLLGDGSGFADFAEAELFCFEEGVEGAGVEWSSAIANFSVFNDVAVDSGIGADGLEKEFRLGLLSFCLSYLFSEEGAFRTVLIAFGIVGLICGRKHF